MNRSILALAVVLAAFGTQAQSPQNTFRAATHGVSVDVAVFDGNRVVTGLGIEDFELKDNGVRQTLTTVDFNVLPIDLRLVFDTSGSISEEDLALYLRAMRQVAATLAPRDRCEIITFNARIADAASRQNPPVKIDLRRVGPEGTSFFDAVSLAMVTVPSFERRQITIVLSDALDNGSFFDESMMMDAARRTDAVVYTILPGDPEANRAVSTSRLLTLSLLTGGRLLRTHEKAVGDALITALEEFRQSYVLRYDVTGVPIDGWHKLEVKVRRGFGYKLRMKTGYLGKS